MCFLDGLASDEDEIDDATLEYLEHLDKSVRIYRVSPIYAPDFDRLYFAQFFADCDNFLTQHTGTYSILRVKSWVDLIA